MLFILKNALAPARQARWYSRTLPARAAIQATTTPLLHEAPASSLAHPPYFVPRNTRGSLPVYTDIRNSNKYLTLIRNVEGNVDVSPRLILLVYDAHFRSRFSVPPRVGRN